MADTRLKARKSSPSSDAERSPHSRKRAVQCAVCAGLVFGALLIAYVPLRGQPMKPRYRTGFQVLNDKSIAARKHDKAAIRALTEEIINRNGGAYIPLGHSLRNRIFQAEHGYQRGTHKSVSEREVADAMNALVDEVGAPDWARTNVSQLHLLRTLLKPHVPSLVGTRQSSGRPLDFSDEMSPAEATFVLLLLANNKISNTDYQIGPD